MKLCILLILVFLAIASAQVGQSYGRRGRRGRGGCPRWKCGGGGERPPWCPPQRYCLVNPCTVSTCPAFPRARCLNDDICNPACSGNFYIGRRRLSYQECNYRG